MLGNAGSALTVVLAAVAMVGCRGYEGLARVPLEHVDELDGARVVDGNLVSGGRVIGRLVGEPEERGPYGMVPDEGEGEWRIPTTAEALQILATGEEWDVTAIEPAVAVLRASYDGYPPEELEPLVDELVRLILEGTEVQNRNASIALFAAALPTTDTGTSYAGALDALIRAVEGIPEGSGGAVITLGYVVRAGGTDYVRRVFAASERPPPCGPANRCPNLSRWCITGYYLVDTEDGPDRALYQRTCESSRPLRN
ncbi:hypothetical protein [Candidatus Palauibacter sp.]|uniref:hypothetical protein n=1 Tax=Candidatus Palauibacter sp. TaxID=3101350 RepID=UPI003B59EB5A